MENASKPVTNLMHIHNKVVEIWTECGKRVMSGTFKYNKFMKGFLLDDLPVKHEKIIGAFYRDNTIKIVM
jgi:hypothetical protein